MIRLGAFCTIFALMALWETAAPRRPLSIAKPLRWTSNILLVVLNTALLRVAMPTTAVGLALFAEQHGWGLLHRFVLTEYLTVPVTIVAFDCAIYLQHVMFHAVPVLWRLHRVHHADLDFDVTTGSRFHPVEIFLSTLVKFAVVVVLGPPAVGVLMFEVLLNATAMFNHSNVRMPAQLDHLLRLLVVTPDMHRVHHSIDEQETNSNFGFNLSWWDRLLGTYRGQPAAGHDNMILGIHSFRDPGQVDRLPGMLVLPFIGAVTDYTIDRRRGAARNAPQGNMPRCYAAVCSCFCSAVSAGWQYIAANSTAIRCSDGCEDLARRARSPSWCSTASRRSCSSPERP